MSDHPHSQEDAFGSPPAAKTHRFYFDTDDGVTFSKDEDGLELAGLEAARVQAQSALADMARDIIPEGGTQRAMVVRVRDEAGRTVLQAELSLRVQLNP